MSRSLTASSPDTALVPLYNNLLGSASAVYVRQLEPSEVAHPAVQALLIAAAPIEFEEVYAAFDDIGIVLVNNTRIAAYETALKNNLKPQLWLC